MFFNTQKIKISSEIIDKNVAFFNIIFSHQEEFRRAFFEEKNTTSLNYTGLLGNYVVRISIDRLDVSVNVFYILSVIRGSTVCASADIAYRKEVEGIRTTKTCEFSYYFIWQKKSIQFSEHSL